MRFLNISSLAGVLSFSMLIAGCNSYSYDSDIPLFGVHIPILIFLLTLIFIVVPFLYYFLKFTIREVPSTISRFKKLRHTFGELNKRDIQLTGPGVEELRSKMVVSPEFAHCWQSFELTLIQEDSGPQTRFWASLPLSEAFNMRTLVHPRVHLDWYRTLPGILTGFGLLLTFLAILMGLAGVQVSPDQSVLGIDRLVNNLSGKFFSSVVALSLSTVFLIQYRFQERWIEKTLAGLVRQMETILPRKTPEMLLYDISRVNVQQSDSLRHLITDVAGRLPASFQESLSPTLLALNDGIERLRNEQIAAMHNFEQVLPLKMKEVLSELFISRLDKMTATLEEFQQHTIEGTQDTFGELVERFNQSLTGGTDAQISRLSEVLGTTSSVLQSLVDKFHQTHHDLDDQIGRVLLAVERQTMTLTQGVVDKFMETVEHLTSMTQASSQTLTDTAGQAVAHVAEEGQKYLVNLEKVGNSLEDQVTRMMAVMHEQTGMVTDETAKALQEAVAQIRTISEVSVNHVTQASESALGQLTQRGGEYFDQVRGSLEHLVRRASELAQALNQTSENILIGADGVETTFKQYGTAIQEGSRLIQDLQGVTATMGAVSRDSRVVTDQWLGMAATQQEVTGRLGRVVEDMRQISSNSHDLMEKAPVVFSSIHQDYGQIIEVMHKNIQDYTATVKQGLESFILNANTYFGDTVQKLGGAVGELSETLQDLTDELQQALTILRKEGKQ